MKYVKLANHYWNMDQISAVAVDMPTKGKIAVRYSNGEKVEYPAASKLAQDMLKWLEANTEK